MRSRHVSIVIALATAMTGCASAALPLRPAESETAFSPRSDPAFGDATPAINRLVAEAEPRPIGAQHFCAIAYRGAGGTVAWVHWREADRLIVWYGNGGGIAAADALLRSNRNLDLKTDVVADEASIAGSTYLVTRAWVVTKLADCAVKGDHYTIFAPLPIAPPPPPTSTMR